MARSFIASTISSWTSAKDKQLRQRVAALRERDGDHCRRCRRAIRFDLPLGHDKGPKIESIAADSPEDSGGSDNLCLCHGRCNAAGADNSAEVAERIRRKSEAALLAKRRRAKKRA